MRPALIHWSINLRVHQYVMFSPQALSKLAIPSEVPANQITTHSGTQQGVGLFQPRFYTGAVTGDGENGQYSKH